MIKHIYSKRHGNKNEYINTYLTELNNTETTPHDALKDIFN